MTVSYKEKTKVCQYCGEGFSENYTLMRNKDHYECEVRCQFFCGPACLREYEIERRKEKLGW